MVERGQPDAFAADTLRIQVKRAVGALGSCLQSKRDEDLARFRDALEKVEAARAELAQYRDSSGQALGEQVDAFASAAEKVIQTSADDALNNPGMHYANLHANPLQREISGLLGQLLNAEESADASRYSRRRRSAFARQPDPGLHPRDHRHHPPVARGLRPRRSVPWALVAG